MMVGSEDIIILKGSVGGHVPLKKFGKDKARECIFLKQWQNVPEVEMFASC